MEQHYTLQKGLFNAFCLLLMLTALLRSCTYHPQQQAATSATSQTAGAIAGYVQRFCDDDNPTDYSTSNPETITVNLNDGCFGSHTKLPRAWSSYHIQQPKREGDWMAVWCNGQPNPSRPYAYYEDYGNAFHNCRDGNQNFDELFLEGKGTITFRRLTQNPQYAAEAQKPADPSQSDTNQGAKPDKQYELTPLSPEGGDPKDYTFALKQCYREGELIKCWGFITNRTDARRYTILMDSHAVDDEGNSMFIATSGNNFIFEGASWPADQSKLLPNVPTKFIITIGDPHQNVRILNLDLNVQGGTPYRYDHLIFKEVPVQ